MDYDPLYAVATRLTAVCYCLSDRVSSQLGFVTDYQDKVADYINRVFESVSDDCKLDELTPHLSSHSARRFAAAFATLFADVTG